MKTLISLFYNEENDDLFAAIITAGKLSCYSRIGQHSAISEDYLRESSPAAIHNESVQLYNEVKEIYKDVDLEMCEQYEIINILDNEQVQTMVL